MATLNKVMLMGRVVKEPEAPRALGASGTQVVRFRLAVGRGRKNASGGWDKDPNQLYIDCEAFHRPDSRRNLVDLVGRFVKAGDPLFVEGKLVYEEWDDKGGGGKRSKHKIVVESIEFVGGGRDGDGEGPAEGGRQAPGRVTRQADDGEGQAAGGGDDIPF